MPAKPSVIADPLTNRGTAFTAEERRRLGILGRFPSAVETLDEQAARSYAQLRSFATDLDKYVFLDQLHNRNEVLYYRVLTDHLAELLPIVYDPTVGEAIRKWSRDYRRSRAVYLSIDRIEDVRPSFEELGLGPGDVDLLVVSDAEEILGIGDWGVNGTDISVGKLAVYTAAAGIHPERAIAVNLDCGTDNEALLNDPAYLGNRHARVRGARYDALIDDLPEDVTVTVSDRGTRWTRVVNSANGIGSAWSMRVASRPALSADLPDEGRTIRDVAALVRSWNLAEASVGLAAINSWYSLAEVAARNGFVPTGAGLTWREVFDPYADSVEGKVVAIIGHFPFARGVLWKAADLQILERFPEPGDYPDTACEYLLPDADYVFISSSSFVNKTTPRLLDLAIGGGAHTVLVGPSTPMHPLLLDLGVDTVTGYVPDPEVGRADVIESLSPTGRIGPGTRMHQHSAA